MESIFNNFFEEIKKKVIEVLTEMLEQIKQETCEQWVDRIEIAEHLDQSPAWVGEHLHTIPHVKHGKSVRFQKSAVDQWRIQTYGRNYNSHRIAISEAKVSSKRPVKFIE